MMKKLRGAIAKLDPAKVTILTASGLIALLVGFTIYKEVSGQAKELEGPVEFTGPGFHSDALSLLLILVGIVMVVSFARWYLTSGGQRR